MRIKTICAAMSVFALTLPVYAQNNNGSMTQDILLQIQQSFKETPAEKALRHAVTNNSINNLAVNTDSKANFDGYFSNRVVSKGVTNQLSSGRCWLFTGLNVFRAKAIAKYGMGDFSFSQNYNFFWDQLEKSNLFLQGIIDTRTKPMSDRTVEWLFKNALGDGGQFTGVADILTKYGVVPAEVMPETYSSNNTSRMSNLIGLKLKEYGLQLRQLAAKGDKPAALEKAKVKMLSEVYRMLVLNLGEPPTKFSWTRKNAAGKPMETREYTPHSFYQQFIGEDLKNNYVMLMNDPTRDYYKLYTIDYDRHTYDGQNWTYVNLPIEDIKQMAIASIKDSTMMYFSCDVGKYMDKTRNVLDIDYYDFDSLFGTTFGMDKKQRIETFSSGSSHAMTLMAVDLDANGKPKKWMVENSWGPGANAGHVIMTDAWFDNYMFRLVVDKKYITDRVKEILKQKPIQLPAWDPMFAAED